MWICVRSASLTRPPALVADTPNTRGTPPQAAPRTDVPSVYVAPVIYPSLVRKPVSDHSPPPGDGYSEVLASEPDLNKQPTRSALKGGKKNVQQQVGFANAPSPTMGSSYSSGSMSASVLHGPQQPLMQQLELRLAERRSVVDSQSPRPPSGGGVPASAADGSSGHGVRFGVTVNGGSLSPTNTTPTGAPGSVHPASLQPYVVHMFSCYMSIDKLVRMIA